MNNSIFIFASVTTPSVSANTDYSFYVTSTVAGVTDAIPKLVKISVVDWAVSNCKTWSNGDGTACTAWNTGYTLSSGKWNLTPTSTPTSTTTTTTNKAAVEATEEAKALSATTVSFVGITCWVTFVSGAASYSSFTSLWALINQLQLMFLLLLTGAFIPEDVVYSI